MEAGNIQFRLRTDGHNWKLPEELDTDRVAECRQLYRDDGKVVGKSLFSPFYADDFNDYEQRVACYLDGRTSRGMVAQEYRKASLFASGVAEEQGIP